MEITEKYSSVFSFRFGKYRKRFLGFFLSKFDVLEIFLGFSKISKSGVVEIFLGFFSVFSK